MKTSHAIVCAAVAAALLAACYTTTEDTKPADAGAVGKDGGTGTPDTGLPGEDAGVEGDTGGLLDGGSDAGHPFDAGWLDTGFVPDSGGIPDAGGLPDTGGSDAGWPDAGHCTPDCTGKYCGEGDGCGGKCAGCQDPSKGCDTNTWQCDACTLDCGGHGACVWRNGTASCRCDQGWHLRGSSCVADPGSPCDGVSCGVHGTCSEIIFIGGAECICDGGYMPYGRACVDERWTGCRDNDGKYARRGTSRCDPTDTFIETCRDEDGDGLAEWAFGADCAQKPCSTECIGKGCDVQPCPLGTSCVTEAHGQPLWACVVTCDCSNCGNCDMGDFTGMQAQCGSPDGSAPSLACKLPCPSAGDGCIPYSPPICWGLEGCMSASPPF